jgi:hypothetical protein
MDKRSIKIEENTMQTTRTFLFNKKSGKPPRYRLDLVIENFDGTDGILQMILLDNLSVTQMWDISSEMKKISAPEVNQALLQSLPYPERATKTFPIDSYDDPKDMLKKQIKPIILKHIANIDDRTPIPRSTLFRLSKKTEQLETFIGRLIDSEDNAWPLHPARLTTSYVTLSSTNIVVFITAKPLPYLPKTAFSACPHLHTLHIGTTPGSREPGLHLGPSVKSIGLGALSGCASLKGRLVLPPTIETIDDYAFEKTSFEHITASETTRIEPNAFPASATLELIEPGTSKTTNKKLLAHQATETLRLFYFSRNMSDETVNLHFYYSTTLSEQRIKLEMQLITGLTPDQKTEAEKNLNAMQEATNKMGRRDDDILLPENITTYLDELQAKTTAFTSKQGLSNKLKIARTILRALTTHQALPPTNNPYLFGRLGLVRLEAADSIMRSIPREFCRSSDKLKKITLKKSPETIGHLAFSHCKTMTHFNVPTDQIHSIYPEAFAECSSLKSFIFSDKIRFIGEHAFNGCSALSGQLQFKNPKIRIEKYAFSRTGYSALNTPLGFTTFNQGVFHKCPNLRQATLLAENITIKKDAFSHCPRLKNVYLPNAREGSINKYAFDGCRDLLIHCSEAFYQTTLNKKTLTKGTQALITDRLGHQRLYCVTGKKKLEWVEVKPQKDEPLTYKPDSKDELPHLVIGLPFFSSLRLSVTLTPDLPSLPCAIKQANKQLQKDRENPIAAMLRNERKNDAQPSDEKKLLRHACETMTHYREELDIIKIHGVVRDRAFSGDTRLTEINLPYGETAFAGEIFKHSASLIKIGDEAFADCPQLASVSIPSTVIAFGKNIFAGCSGLTVFCSEAIYELITAHENNCHEGVCYVTGHWSEAQQRLLHPASGRSWMLEKANNGSNAKREQLLGNTAKAAEARASLIADKPNATAEAVCEQLLIDAETVTMPTASM